MDVCAEGSTLRTKFISPAGLVTITFTSLEMFLLALKIDDINVQYFFSRWYSNSV